MINKLSKNAKKVVRDAKKSCKPGNVTQATQDFKVLPTGFKKKWDELDVDGSGEVDVLDILLIIDMWNAC